MPRPAAAKPLATGVAKDEPAAAAPARRRLLKRACACAVFSRSP
jgi:hypothetical protein